MRVNLFQTRGITGCLSALGGSWIQGNISGCTAVGTAVALQAMQLLLFLSVETVLQAERNVRGTVMVSKLKYDYTSVRRALLWENGNFGFHSLFLLLVINFIQGQSNTKYNSNSRNQRLEPRTPLQGNYFCLGKVPSCSCLGPMILAFFSAKWPSFT